jgi:O-acetyl-ADP-ribose deacetylase (regulator of RNase III)
MITEMTGNLLRDNAQALVNTVNTVGVMGKGLALQFKRAFPEVFQVYEAACRDGEVQPGRILSVRIGDTDRWVLNFPTKRHWRQPSRLEDVEAGLNDLVRLLAELEIRSVAVPPLGCGNGGLDWAVVRPLIVERLGGLDVDIRLYGLGTPVPQDMPVGTARPELTLTRARLLAALDRYIRTAWESGITDKPQASMIEVQKVAYLLQSTGVDLGLRFEPHKYGPFSGGLNRGLSAMEGHYLLGYGDGTGGARADVRLLEDIGTSAEAMVGGDLEFERAWERLSAAILGYEYPDGMELLASVHYLATRPGQASDPATVAAKLATWSERKRRMFQADAITAAWQRLHEAALLTSDL